MTDTFHGSYLPEDVTFLLKPIRMSLLPVAEKERQIQSGRHHYSEMLSPEPAPSERYLALFQQAFKRNGNRFARDLCLLAGAINESVPGPLTLVSLARAGTPVGVLLNRELRGHYGRDVRHYSVSIIRDRGIDENALLHIIRAEGRPQDGLVFIDGWTGKGVIARELDTAIHACNAHHGTLLQPRLYVVADLCGEAHAAATAEDYLIPSSVLNATVSGLVSRSVLNAELIGPDDFHGCMYYHEFEPQDISRWFVDAVWNMMDHSPKPRDFSTILASTDLESLRRTSWSFVRETMARFQVLSENYVKPGIGEATRVLLRRTPHLLLLRDREDPDVRHLSLLAEEKGVPVEICRGLPYKATALIRNLRL